MKLVNQNNYPDTIYVTKTAKPDFESGLKTTIKSSGCGICSGIMTANFFGYEMSMDEAIKLSYDSNANTSAGTKYVPYSKALCDKFGLTCKRADTKEELFKCLDNNGCCVCNVGGDHDDHIGVFSHMGHYIFIESRDGEKIRILDPGIEDGKYNEEARKDKVEMDGEYVISNIDTLMNDINNREYPFFLFNKREENPTYEKLCSKIDELNDEFIDHWINIVNIDSPSNYKEGVDKVGKYFSDKAHKELFEVENIENNEAGNAICITMNPNSDKKPIVISAHMDTVHPIGSYKTYVEGNELHGPGASDCKGGLVVCALVMQALKEIGYTDRKIIFLLQADEEVGSKLSNKANINYMIEKSKDALCFLNLEMSLKDTAVLLRKGIIRYNIEISGKAAHSSICYEGASAIKEAAYKIIELEKLQEEDGITINVGVISGGTTANTVADKCKLDVDVRFNNDEQKEKACKYIEEIVNKTYIQGTSSKALLVSSRVPMEDKQINHDLLDKINNIFKKHNIETLTARKANGGSDAADISQSGIPTIDSIGVSGGYIHSKNEYANIDSLAKKAKEIGLIILEIED